MENQDYNIERIPDIRTYQEYAKKTAVYQHGDYPLVLLAEESGEALGKLNKYGRKNGKTLAESVYVASTNLPDNQLREDVVKELGDIAWAWVMACHELNVDPARVLWMNIQKLSSRQERGVINGEGDNR